jgi:hypothetical protein
VLEFIENLLRLDLDFQQQDDHSVKNFFVPHMDVLLHSLHEFVNHRRELHRCMACLMNHSLFSLVVTPIFCKLNVILECVVLP